MPRRISFALTQPQFLDGSKTVTRRTGWLFLKAGDHLTAVDRVMGFKKGQKATVFGEIEVVSVRRERLDAITDADVVAEGFPGMTAPEFVAFFCQKMRCSPDLEVTRIAFRKLPNAGGA